jgi:hypothetical protein
MIPILNDAFRKCETAKPLNFAMSTAGIRRWLTAVRRLLSQPDSLAYTILVRMECMKF